MPRERSALKYHCVINHPEKTGITSKSLEALLRGIATLVYFAFGLHIDHRDETLSPVYLVQKFNDILPREKIAAGGYAHRSGKRKRRAEY